MFVSFNFRRTRKERQKESKAQIPGLSNSGIWLGEKRRRPRGLIAAVDFVRSQNRI